MSHTIIPVIDGFEMQLPKVDVLLEIEPIFPEISFDTWNLYMAEVWQTDPKWTLRSWQAAHRLTLIDEPLPPEGYFLVGDLNIDSARGGMRKVEAGEWLLPPGVGRVCWNGVVLLNNKTASTVEDLILPWDKEVHPALTTISLSRRRKSAECLRQMYQSLRS